ncbi:hypothetical protein JRO89_XS05G0004000 [Xanthoceras sorbifolium]|uniref:Cytochrome P450 n=1 Tax=Xanthoceras sorbifolium TaxID=99658 RepID=A0ABQ8HZP5_9ROSI|nr:hypothetical protein JRO89_XS05G0004000 [Xanthoceras sorbifolium]
MHHNLISYQPNTMINPVASTNLSSSSSSSSSSSASSYSHEKLAGKFISRQLLLLHDIQILELLLALIVFIVIHSLRQKKHHGLPVWPVLGMLPSLVSGLKDNMYEWITLVICRQNGTFQFKGPWFSSLNCVVTADPRNLEHLLKTKFSNFPKGRYFRDTVGDLLGDGIFSADDETWLRQRKTASIEFHSAKFRQLTTESLLELVHSRLLPVLDNSVMNKSVSTDLQDILLRLTFDNVCMIAFGVDPGCLRLGLPEIPFAKAFEDATEATVLRFVTPTCVWKTMRYLDMGNERKLKRSIKGVDEFADQVIRTRKKELSLQTDHNTKTQRSDILTVFMRLKDDKGAAFSDKFLRDICVNFILAGRDTSSVALSWFFWLLDNNPRVEDKILEEICRIVGERGEDDQNVIKTRYDQLVFKAEEIKKMNYLQAALSEALRLYPSVPVDHKEVVEDDIFPDGTMKFTAASIIYRYRVKVVKDHPVVPKLALTMYMKHGLKVNLYRRDESELLKYLKLHD